MGYREVCQGGSKECKLRAGPQKFEALNYKKSEQATEHRAKGHDDQEQIG